MLDRLIEAFRSWAQAVATLDDPRGEYLLTLEDRISRLESEVRSLRRADKMESAAL